MATDTRARIMDASSGLFRRQGMTGTGLKQIAATAQAPFGSIYHFFPGGKAELTERVIRESGVGYGEFVFAIFDAAPDLLTAIDNAFATAAQVLVATDYADACPIATIALEVSSTDEPLRIATADVFAAWIADGTTRFERFGLPSDVCRQLMLAFLAALEGAFVLCRSLRSTEPMEGARLSVRAAAEAALAKP